MPFSESNNDMRAWPDFDDIRCRLETVLPVNPWMVGRSIPVMAWAMITTFCGHYRSWASVTELSCDTTSQCGLLPHLQKFDCIFGDMLNFFNLARIYRHLWAIGSQGSLWSFCKTWEINVLGAGQIFRYAHTLKLEALHCHSADEGKFMESWLALLEVNRKLLKKQIQQL